MESTDIILLNVLNWINRNLNKLSSYFTKIQNVYPNRNIIA